MLDIISVWVYTPLMWTKNNKFKCDHCNKFSRPYDSLTIFGGTGAEGLEPYDPEEFCRKCSTKLYNELLVKYKCCYRGGDYQKSNAEMKAAKKAKLEWIGNTGSLVEKSLGRYIMNQYIRESDRSWKRYISYQDYEKQRRDENRCKCWRVKKENKCPACSREEIFCQCKYETYF